MTFDWIKLGGIAAVVIGLVLGALGLHHHVYQQGYAAGAAAVQGKFDAAAKAAEEKRLADEQAARAEEQRRINQQAEIANEATKQADAARVDAAAANVAADGLRARVAQLVAISRAARNSTAARSSAPAGDPLDVLADVLTRADKRAGDLAAYADAARIAGTACEHAYDSLTAAK